MSERILKAQVFITLLNNKVNVERKSLNADGAGGSTEAWNTIITNLVCRIEDISDKLTRETTGELESSTHKMFCELENIYPGDKVVDISSLDEYLVTSASDAASAGHHLEAMLKKL